MYQPSTGDYVYFDKWYGRSITEDTALLGNYNEYCMSLDKVKLQNMIYYVHVSYMYMYMYMYGRLRISGLFTLNLKNGNWLTIT